jgi:uncharacterized membrane protein
MTDLGTLTGDLNSFANDINNKGQVGSGDATSNCRPFLRGNGVMTDLKALNPHDSALYWAAASMIEGKLRVPRVSSPTEPTPAKFQLSGCSL